MNKTPHHLPRSPSPSFSFGQGEVASEVAEAEGLVQISHPTSQMVDLLPDPVLEEEEEEEESDPEEEIRRWVESSGRKGVKGRWEGPTRKE